MTRAQLIARLFAITGTPAPKDGSVAAQVLSECPEHRLPRAVAWYAITSARHSYSHQRIVEALRCISGGWGDYYTVTRIERLSSRALFADPLAHVARVVRPATTGRWSKPAAHRIGIVREHIDLAAAWLAETHAILGCVEHSDCLATYELGRTCAGRST